MKTHQVTLQQENIDFTSIPFQPNLILVFGYREQLLSSDIVQRLRTDFPEAIITGCSTAGQITTNAVIDETSITFIGFEKTKVAYFEEHLAAHDFNSTKAGNALVNQFDLEGLNHVLVFTEGLHVNGTDFVEGVEEILDKKCSVTGGMAADRDQFTETVVVTNKGEVKKDIITAVALYGDALEVSYSSRGGWDSFGIDRKVTKSNENVLYEIDNKPALDLYKSFLGEQAANLPASGLLFPLSMRIRSDRAPVVRTILGINEDEKSLTFAGDIPEGAFIKLMKANRDRLINGAEKAAEIALKEKKEDTQFGLLVSCVGRKLVLKQLIEEEIEVVADLLPNAVLTGFYSYGELAPFEKNADCSLHNQTMTITLFSEK